MKNEERERVKSKENVNNDTITLVGIAPGGENWEWRFCSVGGCWWGCVGRRALTGAGELSALGHSTQTAGAQPCPLAGRYLFRGGRQAFALFQIICGLPGGDEKRNTEI